MQPYSKDSFLGFDFPDGRILRKDTGRTQEKEIAILYLNRGRKRSRLQKIISIVSNLVMVVIYATRADIVCV